MTAFRKWPGITSSPSTSYLRYLAGHFEDGKSIAKTEEVYNGYVSELQKADSYWQFKLETLDGQILTGLCFHEEPAAELQLSFEKKVGCTIRGTLPEGQLLVRTASHDSALHLLARIKPQLTADELSFFESRVDELKPAQLRELWAMVKKPAVSEVIPDQRARSASWLQLPELRMRYLALKRHLPEPVRKKCERVLEQTNLAFPGGTSQNILISILQNLLSKDYTEHFPKGDDLRQRLDERYGGLDEVKEALYDAVWLKANTAASGGSRAILLVGPPGTAKSSIIEDVANIIGTQFILIRANGCDPASILGTPIIYENCQPSALFRGLSTNVAAVCLIDELDKAIDSHQKGKDHPSVANAFLEMLDGSGWMTDELLGKLPTDKILFAATANDASQIPEPLLDRLAIIHIAGYTRKEKLHIARKYTLPKIQKQLGRQINISDDVLRLVISNYTQDAGMRSTEKALEKLAVRAARLQSEKQDLACTIDSDFVRSVLTPNVNTLSSDELLIGESHLIGVCNGQGNILKVQSEIINEKTNRLTGGFHSEQIRESAELAVSAARKAAHLPKGHLHLHLTTPGPKDGTSGGMAFCLAALSAFTQRPIKPGVYATGELDLHGKFHAVGGMLEKTLAVIDSATDGEQATLLVPEANFHEAQKLIKEKGAENSVVLCAVTHVNQLCEYLENEEGVYNE